MDIEGATFHIISCQSAHRQSTLVGTNLHRPMAFPSEWSEVDFDMIEQK
jgi:hypothetical protein